MSVKFAIACVLGWGMVHAAASVGVPVSEALQTGLKVVSGAVVVRWVVEWLQVGGAGN